MKSILLSPQPPSLPGATSGVCVLPTGPGMGHPCQVLPLVTPKLQLKPPGTLLPLPWKEVADRPLGSGWPQSCHPGL